MENWIGNCLGFLGGCAIGSLIIFIIGAAGIGIDNWLVKRLRENKETRPSVRFDNRGVEFMDFEEQTVRIGEWEFEVRKRQEKR